MLSSSVDQASVKTSYSATFRAYNTSSAVLWSGSNTTGATTTVSTSIATIATATASYYRNSLSWSYGDGNYVRPYSTTTIFLIKF